LASMQRIPLQHSTGTTAILEKVPKYTGPYRYAVEVAYIFRG